MAVDSPGHNRKLSRSRRTKTLTNLAIGTHVFMVWPDSPDLHIIAESTGGTVDIDYTYDPGHIEDLATGTAPTQTFAAGVNSQNWSTGATASGTESIAGPISAVQITIATAAVNRVTLANHHT